MRRSLARIGLLVATLLIVAFVVMVINQTAQLVELATRVHPTLGDATLWGLVFIFAACVLVPVWMILRLPRPIVPPDGEDPAEVEAHVRRLAQRLSTNRAVTGAALETRAGVEAAIASLDRQADELTRAAAAQVFLTTAISQNGNLDALVVLGAQSRLIHRIARLYFQRPTLRDMIRLYGNVAATALIASELEDIDLSEQIQPVLSSVLGSAAGAIPGLQTASMLLVNSVMTGSANAFLTLRVGVITRQYCGALVLPPRRALRRTAAVQATQMLGAIAITGASTVAGAVWKASRKAAGGAVTGVVETAGGAMTGVLDSMKRAGSAVVDRFRPGAAEP
ncbi:MAG: YcjF family protein [Gemmatimonadetes bacterium]|nr:YcjF family protein [Gemmatimonadota bacterium]